MQTNYVDQRSMEISIILLVCYNGLLISVSDESNVENAQSLHCVKMMHQHHMYHRSFDLQFIIYINNYM